MLLSEFIERTHYYPTDEEWVRITDEYNDSPIIDKDKWCKVWRRKHLEGASQRAVNKINDLRMQLEQARLSARMLSEKYEEIIASNKKTYENMLREKQRYNDELESLLGKIHHIIENR